MVAPPLVESAQVEYDIEEVKKGEIIKRLTGIANFVPVGNENLYFEQEGGRLKKIHVAQGDLVKKGDILIEIDSGNLRSEEHTSELQSRGHLVCRLLLEK